MRVIRVTGAASLAETVLSVLLFTAFLAMPSLPGARGQQPLDGGQIASPEKRFTGSLTVRQKDGSLYYKIYVINGEVIGGYDAWRGNATHYHRLVGGWFDGKRLALLVQSTQHDLPDKWFSHAHHFEKDGDELVLKHTLYGFGKTTETGEVYTPHVIEETTALSADAVRRQAELESDKPATAAIGRNDERTNRLERLERENARLKQLVGELVLEKVMSHDKKARRN